jgi:hypothetical protein
MTTFLSFCHRFNAVMRDPAGPVEARTIETARIERLLILDRLALFAPMTVHIEAVQIETLQYQLNLLRNGLEPGRRLVYFGTEAEIRSEISRLTKRLHKKIGWDLGVSDGPTRFTEFLLPSNISEPAEGFVAVASTQRPDIPRRSVT